MIYKNQERLRQSPIDYYTRSLKIHEEIGDKKALLNL